MAGSMVAPLPACDGLGLAMKSGQGHRDAGRGLSTSRASPALPSLCLPSPLHRAALIPPLGKAGRELCFDGDKERFRGN